MTRNSLAAPGRSRKNGCHGLRQLQSLAFRRQAAGADLGLALTALWWDGKGDWKEAHEQAQQDEGNPACDWVHAYLHRKEGDVSNARYWYRQAGKPAAAGALEQEWSEIVQALIGVQKKS